MPDTDQIEHDQTLLKIWQTDYLTVFESKDIAWQELTAVAALLALLSIYCAPFLGLNQKLASVAFQTSFILLLIIVLSLVTAAAKIIFQIESIRPRRVFMLLAGHYTVTQVTILTAVFVWGDTFPYYNDVEVLSIVCPVLATAFFILLSWSSLRTVQKAYGPSPKGMEFLSGPRRRDIAAAVFIFLVVNYCNYKIFSDFANSGNVHSIFYKIVEAAAISDQDDKTEPN